MIIPQLSSCLDQFQHLQSTALVGDEVGEVSQGKAVSKMKERHDLKWSSTGMCFSLTVLFKEN